MRKPNVAKPERRRESYRGTSLIIRSYATGVHGKAWCDGRELASVEGVSETDVLSLLQESVDAAIVVETARDAVPYPGHDAYERALAHNLHKVDDKQRLMLDAHRRARVHTLSGEQLAEAAGFRSWSAARIRYASIGRMLGESMLFQPYDRVAGSPMWLSLIGEAETPGDLRSTSRWTMRDQLITAIDDVGIL